MNSTSFNKTLPFLLFLIVILTGNLFSQSVRETPKRVNFGYSQNPKTKTKPEVAKNDKQPTVSGDESVKAEYVSVKQTDSVAENSGGEFQSRSIASKTLEVAKRANVAAASPTEIYKIGIGDVLFISLQNAPAKESTYFTVLNDGAIDFPLAGEMVSVAGLTPEEIEDLLREKIKLYENPQISVKVREHASHAITVLGLIENAGAQLIEREAIPLYVVKAKAVVQSKAERVSIKRANGSAENFDLKDSKTDDVLIFPNDILEFKSGAPNAENAQSSQFYYIGGEIASAGQKDFHPGITLTQAILASGGLRKPGFKKVVIRRKNEQGLLSPIEFDLNSVKDGKQPDPQIQAGDTIEIVKY